MWTKAPSRYRGPIWERTGKRGFRPHGKRSKHSGKPSYLATEAKAFTNKTTTHTKRKQ